MTSVGAVSVEDTQELRDALFHAICLLDHASRSADQRPHPRKRRIRLLG
jgi:hypothetical protein